MRNPLRMSAEAATRAQADDEVAPPKATRNESDESNLNDVVSLCCLAKYVHIANQNFTHLPLPSISTLCRTVLFFLKK